VRWPPATPRALPRRGAAGKGTVPKDEGREKKRDWIKVLNERRIVMQAGRPLARHGISYTAVPVIVSVSFH
jgi:hypothetical protein